MKCKIRFYHLYIWYFVQFHFHCSFSNFFRTMGDLSTQSGIRNHNGSAIGDSKQCPFRSSFSYIAHVRTLQRTLERARRRKKNKQSLLPFSLASILRPDPKNVDCLFSHLAVVLLSAIETFLIIFHSPLFVMTHWKSNSFLSITYWDVHSRSHESTSLMRSNRGLQKES